MALKAQTKNVIRKALASVEAGNELIEQIETLEADIATLEGNVAANVTAIDTADGSDAATTQALANATKTKVNAILTALKAAGLMEADS